MVFEGRWKVVAYANDLFTLKNIYNGNEIVIHRTGVTRIVKGTTTISKIICCRTNKAKSTNTKKDIRQVVHRRYAFKKKAERGEI